jgi:preprotein translocase subunit SecF
MTETSTGAAQRRSLGSRLYSGETSLPIVAHARWWYTVSAVLLVVAIGALVFRGLHLGIEFTGGAELTARVEQTSDSTVADVGAAVSATDVPNAAEPRVVVVDDESVRVQTGSLTPEETTTVRDAIAAELDVASEEITAQVVGPSWGAQITRQALVGLSFFILAVGIFLALIYEWKMAAAALIALVHDIVATVGIYALVGFDVTPATVIGFLTILGYSLYDTVVIFDKVQENTKGITAQNQYTYAEAANLGLNQTLMRSINTVIIALLPIGSILFVGAGLLGAGTLKDLALALFVGVAIGTYSSIFIATPLLVDFKSREPTLAALARRVAARRAARGTRDETADGPVTSATVAGAARGMRVMESGDRRQPQRQTRSQRRGDGRPPR